MNKTFFFILLLASVVQATSYNDALKAREKALRELGIFNPAVAINNYTNNPKESYLNPSEKGDALKNQGFNSLEYEDAANKIYKDASSRPRIKNNPKSMEMQVAENLLDHADEVLEGLCYQKPAACKTQMNIKTCKDERTYRTFYCGENLKVNFNTNQQAVERLFLTNGMSQPYSFNLTDCNHFFRCTISNLIVLDKKCEQLNVVVTQNGIRLPFLKSPSCEDPTLTVQLNQAPVPGGLQGVVLAIVATQSISEESWQKEDCNSLEQQVTKGFCISEGAPVCTDANQSHEINGIRVTRPCWSMQTVYSCVGELKSTCDSLLNEGCSQVNSECTQVTLDRCDQFLQTFECPQTLCLPEQIICPGTLACADGSCDSSKAETSEDMAEGLSRLGALAGVAEDVALNQIQQGMPNIFTGGNALCRKVVAGIGNCCGGHARFLHCTEEEKQLAQAIEEQRAFYVGTYCAEKDLLCLEYKESWCIFASKLASIIQIQGRYKQLGINFGVAWDTTNNANCRGLAPEELERINFGDLDLSPIQQELMKRMSLPSSNKINAFNQAKIEQMKQEGRAHD